jgi:tetratricopeptide (TPR) repeat protein
MNRYWCKFLLFFSILSILSVSIFSENFSSAEIANRQTAIRCAEVAKSFFMQEEYDLAFSQAELGLAYDNKISDLWYVKAMSAKNQSKPKAQVFEFAKKSFENSDWTCFAEDLGIVLYAEVLIQTGNFEKAYEVLENRKDIYSRDAEYLRALSSYLLGDVVKARNIIASAVNVFPEDVRFPKLFYKNEYFNSVFIGEEIDSGALSVANKLNSKISLWAKNFNDILFYAHFFEQNEEVAKRMLLQFYSEYQLIPEAIPLAIEKNILPQEQCRIAFENFSFDGI